MKKSHEKIFREYVDKRYTKSNRMKSSGHMIKHIIWGKDPKEIFRAYVDKMWGQSYEEISRLYGRT